MIYFWHPQKGQCPNGSPILLPEWFIHYSCISLVNLLDAIMSLKIFTFLMEKVGWTLKKWYCWLYKFEIIPFQLGENSTRIWLKSKGQKWALLGIYKSGLVQKMWLTRTFGEYYQCWAFLLSNCVFVPKEENIQNIRRKNLEKGAYFGTKSKHLPTT